MLVYEFKGMDFTLLRGNILKPYQVILSILIN